MNSAAPFRLTFSLILLLATASAAREAGAAAGRVDFASGGTTVSGADGRQRPLAKGAELGKGDTIRTDAAGRAQIRFPDGAYVSLQPNTEFSIKDYNFDGKADGSERGFFSLARGAMRTVTGLIGRVNKNRYQVSTPTATIGIRGTGGRIEVLLDGTTLIAGTSGIWVLSNPSGTLDVPAGTFGRAPSAPNQPPRQTNGPGPNAAPTPPRTPPLPLIATQLPYTQAGNRTPNGTSTSVASNVLQSGPGYTALMAYSSDGATSTLGLSSDGNAVFNSAGQLTSIAAPGAPAAFTLPSAFQLLDGAHADFGTDGVVAWGRWTGLVRIACDPAFPCAQTVSYGPDQGLHYVVGTPTPILPTTGTAVSYGLVGATRPTYADGRSAPGTFTLGSLSVTFAPGAARVDLAFNVAMPDGKGYAYTGTGTATSATFSMTGTVTGTTGGACSGSCTNGVVGTFFGQAAERLGTSYFVRDGTANIVGAAAFAKQ